MGAGVAAWVVAAVRGVGCLLVPIVGLVLGVTSVWHAHAGGWGTTGRPFVVAVGVLVGVAVVAAVVARLIGRSR